MQTAHRTRLASIRRFDQLVVYLRDEMGWPIESDDFEELTFEYTPEELGIDSKNAAKILEIKRLRPLAANQPWGIFFVKFEPQRLPVVALRRILGQVALKKRASANKAERQAWAADDLLFISNYGVGGERQIAFAHFSKPVDGSDLPTLKVLGWDNLDTPLHLDAVAHELTIHLAWPDEGDPTAWRKRWRGAFTLRHRQVITTSKELSIRLAELARVIRDRIKTALAIETDKGPLTQLMKAFQTALVHDLDADGFADMYAQTISYGLLSARIVDPQKKTADDLAAHMRTNPFLRELMETFLKVGGRQGKAGGPGIDFDELGVSEVVELLDDANMEAVVRDFGDQNPEEDPVIHFYELFLKEYDAKKRMQRGVFYTPRPVVSYIVRSVDELLRTEFGLADGLADTTTWAEMAKRHQDLKIPKGVSPDQDFVQILDPATGTGTFLVEVIDLIHETLVTKWKKQGYSEKEIGKLWNEYVPKHLLPRLHGYELLMAPYAIAHLKIGLKLYETGYRFERDERARVYLTNALEPPSSVQLKIDFLPALAHEAQAVNDVKRHSRFTVVVGNPPYSGISSNMTDSAQCLINAYKIIDGKALDERKVWLQDDYVKFIRQAQITLDTTGAGILGYITNHGYLDNPTFRGMRQSLQNSFSRLFIIDLHGNTNKKERCPDGTGDENVFDIRQGVTICLASCGSDQCKVLHSELWGRREKKYQKLADHSISMTTFAPLIPDSPYYFFKPHETKSRNEYDKGWRIPDIFPLNTVGFVTARDSLTIQATAGDIWKIVERFVSLNEEQARAEFGLGKDARDWRVTTAQRDVRASGPTKSLIYRILYRPFDFRFTYYTGTSRGFYASPCSNVMKHMLECKNLALCFNRREELAVNYSHFLATRFMTEHGLLSSKTTNYQAPLYLSSRNDILSLSCDAPRPNLGSDFLKALAMALKVSQRGTHGLPEGVTPPDIFNFTYAVFYSPSYRSRYAEFLKIDFPRLPLPSSLELFRALAKLGGELVALHLLESPRLDHLITEYCGSRNPEVEKASWSNNTVWLDKKQTIGFKGVREEVWNFHIGGYQVCYKWLKDRKGRSLSTDEIAHYQKIVVTLSETIRLMKDIDEVIEKHGGWPGAFQTAATGKV